MKTAKQIIIYGILSVIWLLNTAFMGDAYIKNFVETLNKSCPISYGGTSQINSVEALPNKIIKFNISFTGDMNEQQEQFMSEFLAKTAPIQNKLMISSDPFLSLREMGVKFIFAYHGKNGKEMSRVLIGPDEYNNFDMQMPTDIEETLKLVSGEIKSKLPITEETTGMTIVNCYYEDSTLVTEAIFPNKYIEETIQPMGMEVTKELFLNEILKRKQSIYPLVSRGITAKYLYANENKEPFFELLITAQTFERPSTDNIGYLEALRSAYNTAYVSRKEAQQVSSDDEIYLSDCYVDDNTLIIEHVIRNDLIADIEADAFIMAMYPMLKEELMDDDASIYMIQNGISVLYIYLNEEGDVFASLELNEEDFPVEKIDYTEDIASFITEMKASLPSKDPNGKFILEDCFLEDEKIVFTGKVINTSEEELGQFKDKLSQLADFMQNDSEAKAFKEAGYSIQFIFTNQKGDIIIDQSY